MKISVVTTFHKKGYDTYGRRMIETFLKNWPSEVTLYVYAEDCLVTEAAPNLIVKDLIEASPELKSFKTIWKDVPKANGWCNDSTQKFKDKNQKIGFKWDAVRFAHKVYSIFACARECDSDILLWMDADTICHSPITLTALERLCPTDRDICFLGRRGKYTECGLYALNLQKPATQMFLKRFQSYYDDAESGIFTLDEWHDSYVFDAVRKTVALNELDWSSHLITGEGHPLINSEWGAYLDHLKGDRKSLGRSKDNDLKVKRTEDYWK
jgi:hypothetical protein